MAHFKRSHRVSRNVMVTLGLSGKNPLPYKNQENAHPLLIVTNGDYFGMILEKFLFDRNDPEQFWNFIVGFETSFIVVPVPVNQTMYTKFLVTKPTGTPYEFVKWVCRQEEKSFTHTMYIKPLPVDGETG